MYTDRLRIEFLRGYHVYSCGGCDFDQLACLPTVEVFTAGFDSTVPRYTFNVRGDKIHCFSCENGIGDIHGSTFVFHLEAVYRKIYLHHLSTEYRRCVCGVCFADLCYDLKEDDHSFVSSASEIDSTTNEVPYRDENNVYRMVYHDIITTRIYSNVRRDGNVLFCVGCAGSIGQVEVGQFRLFSFAVCVVDTDMLRLTPSVRYAKRYYSR